MNRSARTNSLLRWSHTIRSDAQPRRWISQIQRTVRCAVISFTLLLVALLGASQAAHAQTYTDTVLHNFTGQPDGAFPFAGLGAASTENLYGTTSAGGSYNLGTVFKIAKTGAETVVYSFVGTPDGSGPFAGLVADTTGNLYGITGQGGAFGFGTVFKIDTTGQETVLYSFAGGADGSGPRGALALDAAGNLYGATFSGGASDFGTIYKLTQKGAKTILHSFTGNPDGEYPNGGLVRDAAGNLYGTTSEGGYGGGTVFKISAIGRENVLYAFANPQGPVGDGSSPLGGLIRDQAGNLYGTTLTGGTDFSLYGTVFKLSPTGKETVLHSFVGSDGENPEAGVVRDSAGNIFGTTPRGGTSSSGLCFESLFYGGCGTVFEISPNGKELQILMFNGPNGLYPYGGLVMDAAGRIYGTASDGGSATCTPPYGCGVVFELTPR